jgi:HK97 family phage portal protein
MAWYDRIVRSVSGVINPKPWLLSLFGGTSTLAGENVSSTNAPKVSAVFSCVNLIGNTVASLPFHMYRETDQGMIMQTGLLNDLVSRRPNESYNSFDFRKAFMAQLLLRGNAYILPMRNGSNLSGLELLDTDLVQIDTTSGVLKYKVWLTTGVTMNLDPDQIIHLKYWTLDGINGVSPIVYAKEIIGTSMAATSHMGGFYGNGGMPKGVLQLQGTIKDPDRVKAIGSQWDQLNKENKGRTAVLTEGAEYKPVAANFQESQLIESLRFSVEEICRLYSVPPHKIGHMDGAGYANSIEAQNAQFVSDCIRPLVEMIELEFTNKLLNGNRRFVMDMKALTRGDIQTEVQRNVSYWNIGAMSANEIRRQEGLPPIEGGDTYNKPMHMGDSNNSQDGEGNSQPSDPSGGGQS